MSKSKKGAAKKVAPKLIAKQTYYTVINGKKFRADAGDEVFLKGEIKDQLISVGLVEEK